jgi:hypothetical protein
MLLCFIMNRDTVGGPCSEQIDFKEAEKRERNGKIEFFKIVHFGPSRPLWPHSKAPGSETRRVQSSPSCREFDSLSACEVGIACGAYFRRGTASKFEENTLCQDTTKR